MAILVLSLIHWKLLSAKFWADYLKCTELESSKLAQVIFRLFLIFLMQVSEEKYASSQLRAARQAPDQTC